ncbi:MAG TPA: lysylphosphatidylglycerol synthase transmembrane domain-containing protein [Chitinophagaceae bacterium]|nr:lysylphosphatidylglycerol synthase transmembrane domain-containing protein [Chitinophagaceae bacterium]
MTAAKKKRLFSASRIFFYILSIALFIFVVIYFTEIKKDIKLFTKVNVYWLTLALFSQGCTYFLGAIIYRKLLSLFKIDVKVTIWKLLQASIVTLFFNQTVPSAGVSGNTFFFNFLRKRQVPVDDIIPLICIELLTFYAGMEIIIVALVLFGFLFYKIRALFSVVLGCGFLVYLLFGIGIGFLGRRRTISFLYNKIKSSKLFNKLFSRLKESFPADISIDEIKSPGQFFLENKTGTFIATLLQVCIFLADSFTIFALFWGLGIQVSIWQVAMGYVLTKIISLLPFSPGALILYEGGMTLFFSRMGINVGTAVVVTLLYRALSFWLPILLGFFLYRKFQVQEA